VIRRLAPALAVVLAAFAGLAFQLPAQVAGQVPDGLIEGRVVQGSAGGPALDGIPLQLIVLGEEGVIETIETTTGGTRFRFEVPADPQRTYLVRTVYEGVQYLSGPLLLAPELPSAEVELTLYETTSERPELTIESTVVTVVVLDRTNAQLTLERIDEVRNPADRVYVGDERGVTLRLPLPDGVVEASGVGAEGDFTLEGATLAAALPLRPGGATVVTRYVVGYDRADDAYSLRVTAPLATQRLEIEVPVRFTDELQPLSGSARAASRDVSGERVAVIEREGGAGPGGSVNVRLEALSGRNRQNPLTGSAGAVVAVLVALAVVSGGSLALLRARGGGASAPGGSS